MGDSVYTTNINGFEMYKVIIACLILLSFAASAEMKPKAYEFGDCVGHETICEDEFNEIIFLSVFDDNSITTQIQFNHPHILAISEGIMKIEGNKFYSTHSIINNLGYQFTFQIMGDKEATEAETVIIRLEDEQLASIELTAVNSSKHGNP